MSAEVSFIFDFSIESSLALPTFNLKSSIIYLLTWTPIIKQSWELGNKITKSWKKQSLRLACEFVYMFWFHSSLYLKREGTKAFSVLNLTISPVVRIQKIIKNTILYLDVFKKFCVSICKTQTRRHHSI